MAGKEGMDYMRDPRLNKGFAFSESEKDKFKIRGLVPSSFVSQKLQVKAALEVLRSINEDLIKYLHLSTIQTTNERLFYYLVSEFPEEMLPIIYTPIVGDACLVFSRILLPPRGLYITYKDVGRISSILENWPEKNVHAICVTDGERILGFGDLGANGMGIPIGKLALYTALGGVPPSMTLPITIDVGTNNDQLLNDPFYIGLRRKRVNRGELDAFLDEFMNAVVKLYGKSCLIQYEDFATHNALRLLVKYKGSYCMFNDDIQGTSSACVGGIMACSKLTTKKISDNVFLFAGAGSAGMGIAELLTVAMMEEGVTEHAAKAKIWLTDIKGLLTECRRDDEDMEDFKKGYLKKVKRATDLEEIVERVRPTVLIGVSAKTGIFTERILRMMAAFNDRPVVMALSNPTCKAECSAKEAFIFTDGRCLFGSGSPFSPVVYSGKTFYPSQANNSLVFPGVALAIIGCRVERVPDMTFLVAAKALAEQVTMEDLERGRLFPPISHMRSIALYVAVKVAEYFFKASLARVSPEPHDKLQFLKSLQYDYSYGEEES